MTTNPAPAEPVRKELRLRCSRDHAFDVFARRINEWWPSASHSVGGVEVARVDIEGRVGGRVFETRHDGEELMWGQVVCWEPPQKLAFTWHPGAAASQATTVTVTFEEDDVETRVCLEHVGWAVYGAGAAAKRDDYDSGWSKVLDVLIGVVNSGGATMTRAVRLPMVALTSGALTLVLFRLMAALIAVGNTAWIMTKSHAPHEVGRIQPSTPEPPPRPTLPERHAPQRPPATPRTIPTSPWAPSVRAVGVKTPSIDEGVAFDGPIRPRIPLQNGDEAPIARVEPVYPRVAAEQGVEGWVVVRFDVSASGATRDVRVVESNPKRVFDRAAARAVSRWKYRPCTVEGQPRIKRDLQVRLVFKIR